MSTNLVTVRTNRGNLYQIPFDDNDLVFEADNSSVTGLMLWQVYDPADELTLPRVDFACSTYDEVTRQTIYHASVNVLVCFTDNSRVQFVVGYYSYKAGTWRYLNGPEPVGIIPNVTHWAYLAAPVGGRNV